MTSFKIVFVVVNLLAYFFECSIVEGKTLDPIYWNSSNSIFKANNRRRHCVVNAAINDKLDLICPRRNRGDGVQLFYFKLYLVTEENFRKCNTSGGLRLLTCDVPEREKKYTFFFQEISPSPWGLEFEPGKSYYVISTSDGSKSGMDTQKGGVCTRFNMKIELKIFPDEDAPVVVPPVLPPPPESSNNDGKIQRKPSTSNKSNVNQYNEPLTNNNVNDNINILPESNINTDNTSPPVGVPNDQVGGNGLIIGIVLGACAVLFILLLSFLGYKVYRRRRHHKKYQSPPMTPARGATPMQQVTLLPIVPPSHHGRLHSEVDRHPRNTTLSSHSEIRPPPSYNESFLDNGGPVVAV